MRLGLKHRFILKPRYAYYFIGSALIGLALLAIRWLSPEFRVGTTTETHPVLFLVGLLIGAGVIWLGFIPVTKRILSSGSIKAEVRLTLIAILIGLSFRAIFIGSTPIYEDDWNRYLWDGAVITQGISPYVYSPEDVFRYSGEDKNLQTLSALSEANDSFVQRINNPQLTTIYPPTAQAVFALSALIKPFDPDVLRWLYWVSELLALLLLVKALMLFGQSPLWVWLYALNPLVIFTAFNGVHMDILLVPFILGALILVKSRPIWAVVSLSLAVAVKLWPLLLGPVLFRAYRKTFAAYLGYGVLLGFLSLISCLPMLMHIGADSGLSAYSAGWQRSSFLFPYIENTLLKLTENGGLFARVLIAGLISGLSLWYGLFSKVKEQTLPFAIMAITLVLYLLSPTGFPWYVIWFAFLIPFVPSYGVALLCVTVGLYYARFWFGESGQYDVYLNILVPLQFGLPISFMIFEVMKGRRYGRL